jgi:hypothetical protein
MLRNYSHSKKELSTLQSLNRNQNEQLFEMGSLVSAVEEKLSHLNKLEYKIKQMLEADPTLSQTTGRE